MFYNAMKLVSINIPNNVTIIESSAFRYCDSLKEIKLSNRLETIEDGVFGGCESLEDIELPDSLTSIGPGAFDDCTMLESITIPANVTNMGDEWGREVFRGCNKLTEIKIKRKNGEEREIEGMDTFWGAPNVTEITWID